DRRDRRPVCQLPVVVRPGPRCGARLLRRREPRRPRSAVRARDGGTPAGRTGMGGVVGGGSVRDRRERAGPGGRPGGWGARPAASRRERVAYRAFAAVGWLGTTLPTHTGRLLFRWAGWAAYHLAPRVRRTVAANQARVLGRPPGDPLVVASAKEAFRRYARYWF